MRRGVFTESYSLHLHKNMLTRDQQSFRNVFSNGNVTNQQWDIFSYNSPRILSTLRDVDAVKSKMQLFYLSLHRKNDWKRIQAIFVQRSNSVICWKSTEFAENWRWHSSLDRVGGGWEFQQITELWIRVVCLRAKCEKGSVWLEKAKKIRRHHLHLCGSL